MNKISAKRFLDSVSVISYKLTELENTDMVIQKYIFF